MNGESSKRSNLVDVTYQQVHSFVSGELEGTSVDHLASILRNRIHQLRNISRPFGSPSDASRKKVESGTVTLRDKVTLSTEGRLGDAALAVSREFDIDEVEALILVRSFFYNEGILAIKTGEGPIPEAELVEAITPFYYSERIHALRILLPLFRTHAGGDGLVAEIANEILPEIIPNPKEFTEEVITEYTRKTEAKIPNHLVSDVRKATQWAKQNVKEQLILLELLFWSMWDYTACDGPLVVKVYETAYATNMGSRQAYSTLLLDEECSQVLQDMAALWIQVTIEVLELERVADPHELKLALGPTEKQIYWNSPESLSRIHELVTSHADSQFACTYVAWAFFLSQFVASCTSIKEVPHPYRAFFESIVPAVDRSYSKTREATHVLMAGAALQQEAGLLHLLLTLLTNSPVFVTSLAWKTGSMVTDPNAIAYRSVFKGLLIAIVELVPVELIPEFDILVEIWIALFGRSERKSIAGISTQFWQADWNIGIARKAIFDVARARFPIQPKPLIRLLRAMTAAGFLDTDPLSSVNQVPEVFSPLDEKEICGQHVFQYLDQLSTFTQAIPISACSGPHAQYEKLPERMISSSASTGLTYTNLRPLKLPGGSTLPARSIGRLLNGNGGDLAVVAWQHEHSGWKVLLEILTDYVNRRRKVGNGGSYQDVDFGRRHTTQIQALTLEDIGVDMGPAGDDLLVTDILDLVRSLVQDNPELAIQLLRSLETGDTVVSHSMLETEAPDLVQLTTLILEDALSRYNPTHRHPPCTQLITSAMSVLSALTVLPQYSSRVWLYIRSTASLFGSERTIGFTSAVLAAERLTGKYTMTLALLNLVQQLFNEAASSVLSVLQDNQRLHQVKEEVLLRATRFVHSEIWVEYTAWKYAQLGDRFEIGRRVATFYSSVLKHSPPIYKDAPFATLSQAIVGVLVTQATTSAINPLVTSLTSASPVLANLHATRRLGDARRLVYMLESHLILIRILLVSKHKVASSTRLCLLEQALSMRVSGGLYQSTAAKADPIDALASYAKERGMGAIIPVVAMQVLLSLCLSFSSAQDSSPTIIAHLSDPEATVASMARIVMHPYEDPLLRRAVWNFIILVVDKEPALAGLFVSGRFRTPSVKGKEKAIEDKPASPATSAFSIAVNMLEKWKDLWELNPQLLASFLQFLHTVWEHGYEHRLVLETVRKDGTFFDNLAAIVKEELGPVPDYRTEEFSTVEGLQRSSHHVAVCSHAYRMMVKAHAVNILALDIRLSLPPQRGGLTPAKPPAYTAIHPIFQNEEQISELIAEAGARVFDPALYDEFHQRAQITVPTLVLDHLHAQEPLLEREFGDDFSFSTSLLQFRLLPYVGLLPEEVLDLQKILTSINLNMTLAQAHTSLTEAWQSMLLQVVPFTRGDTGVRPTVLSLAANLSSDIASETRSGDMMSSVHGARLALLLALLELAWFSTSDRSNEVQHFISVSKSLRSIILNEAQPPGRSFLGQTSVPFHRPLLQAAYFCARHSWSLLRRPKALNADQRLSITSMLEAILELAIDALRITFDSARQRLDPEVDQDMELLVAVFEQCTRPDLTPSTTFWLSKCQESDIIRASLQLFTQMDLVGYSDIDFLRAKKQPLYAAHVLSFHRALASIPSAAERLASEGILAAYTENALTSAIRIGSIEATLPELPNERSPAHFAYCSMLSVISGIATALGSHGQYFIADVCALIQLYSDQIHRALSWTIGDSLTLPLLEEIEQTVSLFYAVSCSPRTDDIAKQASQTFASDALLLLQQVNYALTHQNHLASVFEPIMADERTRYEADGPQSSSASASSDITDLTRRPFLARMVHRLFRLSGSVLFTLINISRADVILLGEPEDWPVDRALIVPHSKVVLGEPISLGTLLELGNHTLDVLRHLVDRPPAQTVAAVYTKVAENPPDVRESTVVTRRNLEAVLFFAVTQLAMWLSKPEFDGVSRDMDTDDNIPESQMSEKERRASRRRSLTLAERLRRGMTGEMATDLQNLVAKAKLLVAKSDALVEKKGVDLSAVLSNFLAERILLPS
ncbi:hypothetical protein BDW22DRAFT_1397822 [Trametopsis cervina]|nr:hypothetical protein BDW22DRAFT_1397822 [Trametopsis cervina]